MAGPFFITQEDKMKVKNISTRLVTVGSVVIVPEQTETIDDSWRVSLEDSPYLKIIEEQAEEATAKRGRTAKVQDEEKAAE